MTHLKLVLIIIVSITFSQENYTQDLTPQELIAVMRSNSRLSEANSSLSADLRNTRRKLFTVEKRMIVAIDSLKSSESYLKKRIDYLEDRLTSNGIRIEIFPNSFSVPGAAKTGRDDHAKVGNPTPPSPPSYVPEPVIADCSDCENKLIRTENAASSAAAEAQRDKDVLEKDLTNSRAKNKELLDSLKVAIAEYESTKKLLDEARIVLTCVEDHQNTLAFLRRNASKYLASAREDYYTSASMKRNTRSSRKQNELRDSLRFRAWSIFQDYSGDTITVTCGSLPEFVSTLDFMEAKDHLAMSYLIANDLTDLINKYGNSTDFRVMQMNAALLENIAGGYKKADANGDYDLKQQFERLINRLSSLIIPAPGKEGSSRIIREISKIPLAFEERKYGEVLGIYNQYERVLYDTTIQSKKQLLAEIKYCVGICLLYDLGNLKNLEGAAYEGSWFGKVIADQQEAASELLEEVVEDGKYISPELYDKALYGLGHRYVPKSTKKQTD